MSKPGILVFFGAHPDDESFGPGATLALYALRGVKVFYVSSTRGEVGSVDPELMKGYASVANLRWNELKCAAKVLGLADIIHLGYRDSGVSSSEQNKHPEALAMAPAEQVAARMVKIIRDLKPDVVLTHDAGGGYAHPDHASTHQAVIEAFYAAGDPLRYPEAGPPFKPAKLYFSVRPHGFTRFIIRLMPLFGQDPHHFGRNKDVDMTEMMKADYPVQAVVKPTAQALRIQARATACHASQNEGQSHRNFILFRIAHVFRRKKDYFMREYPPPDRRREKDLFEGIA
jgi:LmbE family N-acetylglucosaminyl deacetylase